MLRDAPFTVVLISSAPALGKPLFGEDFQLNGVAAVRGNGLPSRGRLGTKRNRAHQRCQRWPVAVVGGSPEICKPSICEGQAP